MGDKSNNASVKKLKSITIELLKAIYEEDEDLQPDKLQRTFTVVGNNNKYEQYSNGKIVKTIYESPAPTQVGNSSTGLPTNRKPRRTRKSTNNDPDAA